MHESSRQLPCAPPYTAAKATSISSPVRCLGSHCQHSPTSFRGTWTAKDVAAARYDLAGHSRSGNPLLQQPLQPSPAARAHPPSAHHCVQGRPSRAQHRRLWGWVPPKDAPAAAEVLPAGARSAIGPPWCTDRPPRAGLPAAPRKSLQQETHKLRMQRILVTVSGWQVLQAYQTRAAP